MRTAGLWTLGLVFAIAAACSGDRRNAEDNVRKALEQANLRAVDVQLDEDANVLYLSGTVETLADRTRAEEVANAAVGTTGRVLNDLTVERLDQIDRSDPDADITADVDAALDDDAVFKTRDINIAVQNGVVTVTGEVRTANERFRATEVVKAIPGVREVINELKVAR